MAARKEKCGCKGARSCLLCEDGARNHCLPEEPALVFTQCSSCGELVNKTSQGGSGCHVSCIPQRIWNPALSLEEELKFEGARVIQDFITPEEEDSFVQVIDSHPWAESQSGRRKQDYGPKVNFKRRKVKLGDFTGLPSFSKVLVERFTSEVKGLGDFQPVELCNLDYRPERGASIDPHLDDGWLWGERLITLNLLSDTILTFTPDAEDHTPTVQVEIRMPRRSLIIVSGHARFQWQHSIQRRHVMLRRVAVTLRELSKEFLPGGQSYIPQGKAFLETASLYNGKPTNKFALADEELR